MSSRKPGYLFGVVLLGLLMSLPQVGWCLSLGMQTYLTQRFPINIPGLGETVLRENRLMYGMFWRDQLVDICGYGEFGVAVVQDWRIENTDPETGVRSNAVSNSEIPPSCNVMSFSDRLWVIDRSFPQTQEVIDGQLQPSTFVRPRGWPGDGQRILIDGQPAIIEKTAKGFSILTISGGAWAESAEIVLPDAHREWTFGTTQVDFQRATHLWCLNHGEKLHVLLSVDGCLLYREGLDFRPLTSNMESPAQQTAPKTVSNEASTSTMTEIMTDESPSGWSLVRDSRQIVAEFPNALPEMVTGPLMLVEGQPVAVVAHKTTTGYLVGEFYRLQDDRWSRFATHPFRFGANRIKTAACSNGQRSYVIVSTPLGAADIFAVEANGLRLTEGASANNSNTETRQFLSLLLTLPLMFLCLGLIQGAGTVALMLLYTKPDYQFGNQAVRLASLGWRGLARLLDLALIVGSTIALGSVLTIGFDWMSLAEALNLKVDHPTIHGIRQVSLALGLWLTTITVLLVVLQARWGLTPGKWLCRLRTVRTTLRPCGIAASLAREILFFVDCGDFLWWAPGIIRIAMTDRRQRFGDLVAATIVVDSRSISDVRDECPSHTAGGVDAPLGFS